MSEKSKDLENYMDIEELGKKAEQADQFNLNNLELGKKLEIETESRTYTIEKRDDGYYISGHPEYCPKPTKAKINGSVFSNAKTDDRIFLSKTLKTNSVVLGMHLEFEVPGQKPIRTSRIQDFVELN